MIPDERRRKVLLTALKPLLPHKRGTIDAVELRGRGQRIAILSRQAHERIDRALEQLASEQIETRSGTLREIDLDQGTFVLRELEGEPELHCTFADEFYELAKEALDRRVLVSGPIRRWGTRKGTAQLDVMRLEILDARE